MKCTDYYKLLNEIRRHEHEELELALEPYGGVYVFQDEEKRPIITVRNEYVFEVEVISINESMITGADHETGEHLCVYMDDIIAGEIGYITELIPETEDTKDVTLPFNLNNKSTKE